MIFEGTYHNTSTGEDETRCIRCDASGFVMGVPSLAWIFTVGAVTSGTAITTDSVDLGEGHGYTLVLVRKIGVASNQESLEIQSSIDGERWSPVVGLEQGASVGMHQPPNGSDFYTVQGRPIGRFVRIAFQNGNTAQDDLVLELSAMAGV